MKKMFMVTLAIIAYNGDTMGSFLDFMNPELEIVQEKTAEERAQKMIQPQPGYNHLMSIILKDDLQAFQGFFTSNPNFPLAIAPYQSSSPVVYMVTNGAVKCLKYALDKELLNITERYKTLHGQTIPEFAKSTAQHNPRAAKILAFVVTYQGEQQNSKQTMTDTQKLHIQRDIMEAIDHDDFSTLKMIATSVNPEFDWNATMVGFVGPVKLPNMTPLAYAVWKKSTNCVRFIKNMLTEKAIAQQSV